MSYTSKYSGSEIDTKLDSILTLDTIYPVGSIYLAYNSTSPASRFGGTWTQITDKFIVAAGSTYSATSTGGSATHTHTSAAHTHTTAAHTLTVSEIPSHRHKHPNNGHTFSWGDASSTLWYNSGNMEAASATNNGLTSYQDVNVYTLYTGGGGSHSHGNTGSTTPGNTGSSSNLPPYLAIYIWRRTA